MRRLPWGAIPRHGLGCTIRPRAAPPGAALRRRFADFLTADAEGDGVLRLAFAAACLPHPEKVQRGGEDSFYACIATRSFGVADGVGGWAEAGVDPGKFARRLLQLAHREVHGSSSADGADLAQALALAATRLNEERLQGGTTALLGQLTGTTLAILNLGDSGALLLRPALRTPPGAEQPLLFPRVVFRSSDQTHYFNCPYQLGSGSIATEAPDLVHVRVRAGDIVIAATDGVFDNLFDRQVQAIVARHLGVAWRTNVSVESHLESLAMSIAKQARRVGEQEDHKEVITPFALAAHSEGLAFRGGKLDDTTVLVGLVCHERKEGRTEDDKSDRSNGLPLLHNFL